MLKTIVNILSNIWNFFSGITHWFTIIGDVLNTLLTGPTITNLVRNFTHGMNALEQVGDFFDGLPILGPLLLFVIAGTVAFVVLDIVRDLL